MKLIKVRIQNYRCIDDLSLAVRNYTTLVGANNTGKSTVLRAIQLFLDQIKPTQDDWHEGDISRPIIIEGEFDDIQGWERDTPGVAGIIYDNKIKLRVVARFDSSTQKSTLDYEAFIEPEDIVGWGETLKEVQSPLLEIAKQYGITKANEWKSSANQERFKSHLRANYPELIAKKEGQWTSGSISISAALKQALPQVVVIPAASNFIDDIKATGKTPFKQLLDIVVMPAIKSTDEYKEFESSIGKLVRKIRGEGVPSVPELSSLASELSGRLASIISETEVVLSMTPPEVSKIVGGEATVRISDGYETSIDKQGHGAQRSLIFALIETLAKRMVQSESGNCRSTILLFEEPELYLHPHLMRRLKESLGSISISGFWQVITTTHSPFLIDVANDPLSLAIIQKNTERHSSVRQLECDLFNTESARGQREYLRALLDFNPAVCEVFFAKRVVLVEGDTEIAVFSHGKKLLEMVGESPLLADDTTIVSCDGKWTITAVALILNALGVPFRVMHDLDAKGRSTEELEALTGSDPYCANNKIESAVNREGAIYLVNDTFEHVLWPGCEAKSDKPFNAWKEIKNLIETNRVISNQTLVDIIKFVYVWSSV